MRAEVAGRPLLAASLGLVIGITSAWHLLNGLFLIVLLALVWKRLPTAIWAAGACLVGLIVAPPKFALQQFKESAFSGEATVASVPNLTPSGESCVIESGGTLYQLSVKGTADLAMGQTLSVYGTVRPLHGEQGQRLLIESVQATISARAGNVSVLSEAPMIVRAGSAVRSAFTQMVSSNMPSDQASLVNALCFASGSTVSGPLRRDLQNSGSIHILTVSGLQVFLLAWILQLLLGLLPIPRAFQIAVIALVLTLYALATGLHPSVLRASIMAVVAFSAYLFRREPDFLSALGLAAIVTLLWQPWTVFTPGFQLSFVCVAALTLYWKSHPFKEGPKLLDRIAGRIWMLLRSSLIVALASAPIVAFHYGIIPLLSPVATLLIAPVLPVIIVVALVAFAFGFLPPLQAGLLHFIAAPLTSYISFVVQTLGSSSWSAIEVPSFNAYWLVPYYTALLLVAGFTPRHR